MFERFTTAARDVIVEAHAQRQAAGAEEIRSEHLLLALLADGGPCGDVLRQQGLGSDLTSGPSMTSPAAMADDELLKALGIDIEAVRESVEQAFGPGALGRARESRHGDPGRSSRRSHRTRQRGQGGRSRFNPDSKRVLELSLRESLRLKTKHIGPEHIGLGLLLQGESGAMGLLSANGVDVDELRSAWEAVASGAPAR